MNEDKFKAQLELLKQQYAKELEQISQKFIDDNQCIICTMLFYKPVQLQCLHEFCAACISDWLQKEDS